jgi:hypothetical protein
VGWGKLWEVDDSIRNLLVNRRTKAEWYQVLGILKIESAPELNAHDSVRFWGAVLNDHPGPLGLLFKGEMHTDHDDYGDPNVLFLGRDNVTEIAQTLNTVSKEYFIELFRKRDITWTREAWLYEPLRSFLSSVSSDGKAVIIIWEN